jgi:hypothetical protein
MRLEHHEINDPPKAPEKLNWLLKCTITNQEKKENKPKDQEKGKHGMEHQE